MTGLVADYGIYGIICVSGLLAGVLVGWLSARRRLRSLLLPRLSSAAAENAALIQKLALAQERSAELGNRLTSSERRIEELQSCRQDALRRESAAAAQAREREVQLEKLEAHLRGREQVLRETHDALSRARAESAELKAVLEAQRTQAAEKIALLNEARDRLKTEFENLAQQIFEEKSRKFGDQNRTALDQLIAPLRRQLDDFKQRVEDVYDKEARDRTALRTEIGNLKELNQRIGQEALNLTRALKGDSKVRGNWGEVILERVLEASGLQKGREYDTQVSLQDSKGARFQPDAVIRLPDGKDIVVDAKVSLKDYEAYYAAEEPAEKEKALQAHLAAVRLHIRNLSDKRYQELEGLRSLDFVLMFVPIEAAFLAAVEKDRGLFGDAFAKNIMVVGPSTLLVTLRTIHNIWRSEYQNRHALEIARKAGAFYDKFVGFVEALEEIGRMLEKARGAYRTAYDRLAAGRGNLIRRSQELKELGVKAGKELPQELLEISEP